ncbi:MAG: cytochrome c biogenesis protein CcsA [Acidimicrobiia bacterium]|nr:cytochrome c biogenesis protein CcsA [Acidimicrobiia bacterium]
MNPAATQSARRDWLGIVAAVAILGAFILALLSPPDRVQGDLTRMLYIHVPTILTAYLAFIVTTVATIAYLVSRRLSWDRLAASSAEVGVVFLGLAILTGMVWGKPVWGVWWTWDARLTTTALMFFIYLGYLGLRRGISDPVARARRSAILGIVAVAQIPIVHFSVTWWNALHQPPTILRPGDPQIDTPLLIALLVGIGAFMLVYAWLVARRVELERHEAARLDAAIDDAAPVAGDAITSPSLDAATGPSTRGAGT